MIFVLINVLVIIVVGAILFYFISIRMAYEKLINVTE